MRLTLSLADWIVIGLYVAMTFGIALRCRMGQKTANDYFLAGRSMNWIVVALSLYATLFSTISFIGVPAEAYENGVLTYIKALGYAAFTPLAVWLFLRYFYTHEETFTAYEYLERRFDLATRTMGATIFVVARVLYGAVVFYSAAQVFYRLTGASPYAVILVIGVFSVAYTTIGGLRAVMVTDVIQTVVIFCGLFAIALKGALLIGFDFAGMWSYAVAHDHGFGGLFEKEFFSLDPKVRYTLWIFLLMAVMEPLQQYGTDQLVVQRFLAAKNYREARRAIYLKTLMTPAFMAIFFAVGLILFYYYATQGELPEGVPPDQVMAHFIITELPAPLPGLIAAALIAALMSTVDSAVGSLSTVTCFDFLVRFGVLEKNSQKELQWGKKLTLVWGAVIILMSLGLTAMSEGRSAMVFELVGVWGALWGVLLVVMLAGVLTRRVPARAARYAMGAGMVTNLILPWYLYFFVPEEARMSPFLLPMPGVVLTAGLLVGLTWWWPGEKDGEKGAS